MIARPTGPGVRSHPSTVDRTRPHGVARAVNRASARGLRGPVERTGCEQGVIYAADRSARSGAGCQAAGARGCLSHPLARPARARSLAPAHAFDREAAARPSASVAGTMHDARSTRRMAGAGMPQAWASQMAAFTCMGHSPTGLDLDWTGLDWIGRDGTGRAAPAGSAWWQPNPQLGRKWTWK